MFFWKKKAKEKALNHVNNSWKQIITHEPFSGAWQRNQELTAEDMLSFHAVFACVTLIASDISKLSITLNEKTKDGIWQPKEGHYLTNLLHKPNSYQTRPQFIESWVLSKQARGNAYILKEKTNGRITALHVLHPDRVTPLVSDSGTVYYRIGQDKLATISETDRIVDADQIIHDRFNCLYHPLVGLSPLYAAAISVAQGQQIQKNSATFFGNNSTPGGILIVPGAISDETSQRLKAQWEEAHSSLNKGKVAVLGDGIKYESIALTASDSQLIEQLKWTAEIVCSVFHVPPYKIGVGTLPSYNNIQALNQEYYSQCLQRQITDIQRLLNADLNLSANQGFRFDLESLLMMDTQTQTATLKDSVASALMTPNEARKKINLSPVEGGNSPYLQQQNFSLEALAKRDAQENPFTNKTDTIISTTDESKGADTDIQQTALNGAQVTALQGVIFAVSKGEISVETAKGLVYLAVPSAPSSIIDGMLKSITVADTNVQIDNQAEEEKFILSEIRKGLLA